MSQTIFTVSAGGTPVMPLLEALDEAVYAAGRNILQLGGYMIFFNLLNLLNLRFFIFSFVPLHFSLSWAS